MKKWKAKLLTLLTSLLLGCTVCSVALLGTPASAETPSKQKNVVDLVTDVKNVTFTAATDLGENGKGLSVTAEREWYYALDGAFYGNSRFEYVVTAQASLEGGSFSFVGADGKRVLTTFIAPAIASYSNGKYLSYYGGVYLEKDYANAVTKTYPYDETGEDKTEYSFYTAHSLTATGEKTTVEFLKGNFTAAVTQGRNKKALTTAVGSTGFLGKGGDKFAVELKFGQTALSVCMDNAEGVSTEIYSISYEMYPEIENLQNGYTVQIGRGFGKERLWEGFENYAGSVISLLSINGTALSGETLTLEETFADIAHPTEFMDGKQPTISMYEGETLGGFTYSSYLGAKNTTTNSEWRFTEAYKSGAVDFVGENYKYKACGEYSVDVTHLGNTKTYTLVIGKDFSKILNIGDDGKITLTPASTIGSYKGALLQTSEAQWNYSINGTFYGDSDIEFTFAEHKHIETSAFAFMGADGNRVFTALVSPGESGRPSFGAVYLENDYKNTTEEEYEYQLQSVIDRYVEGGTGGGTWKKKQNLDFYKVYTVDHEGKKVQTKFIKNNRGDPSFIAGTADQGNWRNWKNAVLDGFMPSYDGKLAIRLVFGDTALSVRMDDQSGNSIEIVSLDYATYPEAKAMKTEGYTIQIGRGAAEQRDWAILENVIADIPSILSINGEEIDDALLSEFTYEDCEIYYKGEREEDGVAVIELDETDDLSFFKVTTKYLYGGLFVEDVEKIVYLDEKFSTKAPGEYNLTFVYGGKNNGVEKDYKVIVKKSVPQLNFVQEIDGYTTLYQDKNDVLTASSSDVLAEDKVDGVMNNVTVGVKFPNTSSFVPFGDSFAWGEFGDYVIRYSAVNTSGTEGYAERVVRYLPSLPKITLQGEIPSKGYVGVALTLPQANTGTKVSLVFEGNAIALTDGSFTPQKEGEYEVTYVYTDEYDQTAVKQATITVEEDLTAPVITLNGVMPTELVKGQTLTPPTATAVDNADGEISVTVEIFYQGEKVGENSVVLNKAGVYTVRYTATDASGNRAEENYQVEVTSVKNENGSQSGGADNGTDSGKKFGCSSCKGSISGLSASLIAGIGASLVMFFAKRKKND